MNKERLFGIGDVARLFHLSVSSLRHYENAGLLTPEYTDPHTGYRYYSPRQFEVLNTIRYLRVLDMPLAEIADFLRNREVDRMEEKLRQQIPISRQAVSRTRWKQKCVSYAGSSAKSTTASVGSQTQKRLRLV